MFYDIDFNDVFSSSIVDDVHPPPPPPHTHTFSTSSSFSTSKPPLPQGPGYCDHSSADRVANLVTCIPYCLLAARNVAQAQTRERKVYAGALSAVAVFSTAYHALERSHKEAWARKADYWAIACAATSMGRMLFPKGDCPGFHDEEEDADNAIGGAGPSSASTSFSPPSIFPSLPRRGMTRVSLSLTPFQPFAVITAHSVAMEKEFARRARRERRRRARLSSSSPSSSSHRHHHHSHHHNHSHHNQEGSSRPSISAAHRLHVLSGTLAVAAFFAEDLWPRLPFVHSTWHVLSAVAMAATEPLVDDAERRLLRGRARAEAEARKGGGSV